GPAPRKVKEEFSTLIPANIRRNAARDRDTEQVGPFLATFSRNSTNPYLNYAIPDTDARPTHDDIESLGAAYERRGLVPRLEYLPKLAPTVEVALLAGGFTVDNRVTLMVCHAYDEPEPPPPEKAAGVRSLLDKGGLAVLARDATTGEPAGGGVCDVIADGVGELAGFGIRAKFRRRGIGAAITSYLTVAAHRAGATTAFLTPGGDAEERIYRRAG